MRRLSGLSIIAAVSLMMATACGNDTTGSPPQEAAGDTTTNTRTKNTAPDPGTSDPTASPGVDVPQFESPRLDLVTATATQIANIDQPVNAAVRANDPAVYIVGQSGTISRLADGQVSIVADLGSLTTAQGEQGLLGLAFSKRGDLGYVNYTDVGGTTVIAEYRLTPDGSFVTESQRILLEVEQPFGNHNGGHLLVDSEGFLLIGMGDGGAANDPQRLALDPISLQGKILRIDPRPTLGASSNGKSNGGERPYGIHPDNPFADGVGGQPEILILGVRNPWKFTIDPATGDLWVADVGQNAVEEATRLEPEQIAGASLGWSAFEGDRRVNDDQPADGHFPPTLVIEHGAGDCSISGGMVYRGTQLPALVGAYVFSDYCSGRIYAFDPASGEIVVLLELPRVTAVLPGPEGEILVLSHSGEVWQLGPG